LSSDRAETKYTVRIVIDERSAWRRSVATIGLWMAQMADGSSWDSPWTARQLVQVVERRSSKAVLTFPVEPEYGTAASLRERLVEESPNLDVEAFERAYGLSETGKT
jgi:hypothetical protein